jgi:hypothetical protein
VAKEPEAREVDWNVCNEAWRSILQRRGGDAKATDFGTRERVVLLAWTVYGIVGNGGFEYLFSSDLPGDPTYRLSVEAFRAIDCEVPAKALEAALATFPDGTPPADEAERAAVFSSQPEEKRDALARDFLEAERQIERQLAAYIRKHRLSAIGH